MKRFLILIVFALLLVTSVKAADSNLEIEFSEFCPYLNMQNLDTSKHYLTEAKKYWVKRKLEFEEHKAACLNKESYEEKVECIQNMRELQKTITKDYINQETEERTDAFSPVLRLQF